ncbi:YajQ family cyclic di-GMP-binding protein [Thiocapsa bogorovii]|uniref:YajQ family cyclic di-GMP-binding protein n=1 Tax=Thiocapsa bogorovii TaxID=521689 RepID=UPI001E38E162|nr:YajQ family cyclic di-GMP-binding protein [Thiocapsa bogorovii]UHD16782.1 YajQ family cyclic di-GMP-binding protein [Thiocapsa bogorovii]
MPSFDIVSEIDLQEVRNAVDQANREIDTRFDFKGVKASFELSDGKILMIGEQEFHLQQMMDILRQKLVKRKIDLSSLDPGDPVSNLSAARQEIALKQGVDSETAKRMVKAIKASKTKVQAQIQGDQVRVSGKKRDDLQEAIALLRDEDWGLPIQFTNFRD